MTSSLRSTDVTPVGLVVVDKPSGWTSHDVVGRLRRLAGTRKVGHAGTLDPMATGVLVVAVGRATRLLGHLTLTDKAYDATIRLGASTVTDDAEGDVISRADASALDRELVERAMSEFVGDIEQVPSSVSAIKVNGVRSYTRVRSGEDVHLPARPVTVMRFDATALRQVESFVDVDVQVECSSGTYVRALARDLGRTLGVGGHLTMLRRTRVGPFTLADARTLDQLADQLDVIALADAAHLCFRTLSVERELAIAAGYGQALPTLSLPEAATPVALLDPDGLFVALYAMRDGVARPVAVFA